MWSELNLKECIAAHPYIVKFPYQVFCFFTAPLTWLLVAQTQQFLDPEKKFYRFLTLTRHNSLISPSRSVPQGPQCDNNE